MSDTLYVASRKGLFTFKREAEGWAQSGPPAFLAEPVTAFLKDARDGTMYVALNLGHFGCKMHRSTDGGANWTELPVPAYPASDAPDAPALDFVWTLVAGGADQPGQLWAGTLPGGLFKSTDHGESWHLVESLWNKPERERWFGGGYDHPGIHSVLVDPRNSAQLTVGISCGGVWLSEDGGETWQQGGIGLRADFLPPEMAEDPVSQDPHLLQSSAANPERVWCQHHCSIFVSTDRGRTFSEVTNAKPTAFGFAVAAHPKKPDTAWFAPAIKDEYRVPKDGKFVISQTQDGGKSFRLLDKGLPQGLSYDLIYRHALVCDGSGEKLAAGSTTGNLWVSEDGGESWGQISSYLPPIAQVAFG
ncbi:MAG TPA: hypothetical protein VLA51_13045 [Paracoccaceae bacterium]|nr:hypothetical protein [Paracoccaceae bacterium]